MERPRIDSIILGSIVSLSLLISFFLLGLAFGLSVEKSILVIAIFGLASTIAAFFLGGAIASRLNTLTQRMNRYIQGICVWAVASIVLIYVVSSLAGPTLKMVLNQAGLGVLSTVGLHAALDQVTELNPRLETEIKIKEGKAITEFKIDPTKPDAVQETKQAIKSETKSLEKQLGSLDEIGDDLQSTSQKLSWALVGLLATSLASSIVGVLWGAPKNAAIHV